MTPTRKSVFALIYRAFAFALGTVGLVLICRVQASGFMSGGPLVFYTIQTNILTTVVFGLLALWTLYSLVAKKIKRAVPCFSPSLQLSTTLYIFVTFFVYWTVLFPADTGGIGKTPLDIFANITVHALIPLLALFDWIVWMPHGRLKRSHAFYWLAYPLLYYLFTVVRAHVGGPLYRANGIPLLYPYFFIDVGYWESLLRGKFPARPVIAGIVLLMITLFYALARLCLFLDQKMGAKTPAAQKSPTAE